jgi:hypothetical protein
MPKKVTKKATKGKGDKPRAKPPIDLKLVFGGTVESKYEPQSPGPLGFLDPERDRLSETKAIEAFLAHSSMAEAFLSSDQDGHNLTDAKRAKQAEQMLRTARRFCRLFKGYANGRRQDVEQFDTMYANYVRRTSDAQKAAWLERLCNWRAESRLEAILSEGDLELIPGVSNEAEFASDVAAYIEALRAERRSPTKTGLAKPDIAAKARMLEAAGIRQSQAAQRQAKHRNRLSKSR